MQTDFILIEKTNIGDFPVGSLINSGTVLYRDIAEKHIFKKGNYQAIATDDVVIKHLENSGCTDVVFYLKDKKTRLRTNFQNYLKAKPKKMQGRYQRFVPVELFEQEPQQAPEPRPLQSMFIEG